MKQAENAPDVKFWPPQNHVAVSCPACQRPMQVFIGSAREYGMGSRLDVCWECDANVIVEATASGIQVYEGREVADEALAPGGLPD